MVKTVSPSTTTEVLPLDKMPLLNRFSETQLSQAFSALLCYEQRFSPLAHIKNGATKTEFSEKTVLVKEMVYTLCGYRGMKGSINEGLEIQAEGYGVSISIG